MYKQALLINKNGDEFVGWTTEVFKPATGELIFNTAMTGFVEILSDPSYINQMITFTSSHVGNYGMSKDDFESNLVRRVCGLLYVSDKDSGIIKSKIINLNK